MNFSLLRAEDGNMISKVLSLCHFDVVACQKTNCFKDAFL